MSAVAKIEAELPATISPALVSQYLTEDIVTDPADSVSKKQVYLISSPSVVVVQESEEQKSDYFSDIIKMLTLILNMISQISNNSELRAQSQIEVSNVLVQNQKITSDQRIKEIKKQEHAAEIRRRWGIVAKVFGFIVTAFTCVCLAATGNFVAAALTIGIYVLSTTGVIDSLTNKIVDACGLSNSVFGKLIVKLCVIVGLSIFTGGAAGLASGGLAALAKTETAIVANSLKYAGLIGLQTAASSNIGGDLAAWMAEWFGGDKMVVEEVLSILFTLLLSISTIYVGFKAGMAAGNEVKAADRLAEVTQTSEFRAMIQKGISFMAKPSTFMCGQTLMLVPTAIVTFGLFATEMEQSKFTKERGSLEAFEFFLSQMRDLINTAFNKSNEENRTQIQTMADGIRQIMHITDSIAYAASIMV